VLCSLVLLQGRDRSDGIADLVLAPSLVFNRQLVPITQQQVQAIRWQRLPISQQNNSWLGAVTGTLGGIAGVLVSGGMLNLGKGVGFFGQKVSPQQES